MKSQLPQGAVRICKGSVSGSVGTLTLIDNPA